MAWKNSGNWAGMRIDWGGAALAELGAAINEIEVTVSKAKTEWPAPVNGTDPVEADFDNELQENYLGDSGNFYIASLKFAIEALVPSYQYSLKTIAFWSKARDSDALYEDIEDLLGDGSYGSSWHTPTSKDDVRLLLQLKEAVEALRWPLVCFGYSYPSGSRPAQDTGTTPGVFWTQNWELSWDTAVADSHSDNFSKGPAWRMGKSRPDATLLTNASFTNHVSASSGSAGFFTDGLAGAVVSGHLAIFAVYNTYGGDNQYDELDVDDYDTNLDITVKDGLSSQTAALSSGTQDYTIETSESDRGSGWPTLGSKTQLPALEITQDEPANAPFLDGANPAVGKFIGVAVVGGFHIYDGLATISDARPGIPPETGDETNSCRVYMDITNELTWPT